MINNMMQEVLEEAAKYLQQSWKDKKIRKKIEEDFLDPVLEHCINKFYPYFIISSAVVFILIFLVFICIVMILRK